MQHGHVIITQQYRLRGTSTHQLLHDFQDFLTVVGTKDELKVAFNVHQH